MNYILFDTFRRNYLLPLTFLRPTCDIRIGILTIREKWEKYLDTETSTLSEDYLQKKFPLKKENDNILINGSICPNSALIKEINNLELNQALTSKGIIIALRLNKNDIHKVYAEVNDLIEIECTNEFLKINNSWDIFSKNEEALISDFDLLTKNRKSQIIDPSNTVQSPNNIFIEEGAKVFNASLNASSGPIYIGKDSEIMEGALIRGPFALCEKSSVKMGAKIYGATTVGPESKVGGELSNVVIFGLSNKGHEGYLGNAVIGEWCNIGADTNNSNLKNTYEYVKIWNYADKKFTDTGLQFCGLIMGDHSKCGINTMFNTGTVVGIGANIFGAGFQRNFIQSFAWGGISKMEKYDYNRAMKTTLAVFKRRNREFDETEKELLTHVYNLSLEDNFI